MALPIRNSRIRLSQGLLFWREVGAGATVVFLHGAWTDSDEWLPLLEHLGKPFHCIAPDLLGFGESDRPKKCHYSIELEVDVLSELLDTLGVRSCYLVGHSLGGWIAASYALRYPEQVKGMVLINPEGVEVRSRRSRWRTERWLTSPIPLQAWLLQLFRPLLNVMGKGEGITQRLRQRRHLLRSAAACQLLFRRRAAELQAELMGDRIAWFKMPLLLLQSQTCDAELMAIAGAYAQAPLAMAQVIPSTDVDLLHTHAVAVAQRVSEFVQTHERSSVGDR
jgi:pimeloyl-ACP methyl ester carboxylesterase